MNKKRYIYEYVVQGFVNDKKQRKGGWQDYVSRPFNSDGLKKAEVDLLEYRENESKGKFRIIQRRTIKEYD